MIKASSVFTVLGTKEWVPTILCTKNSKSGTVITHHREREKKLEKRRNERHLSLKRLRLFNKKYLRRGERRTNQNEKAATNLD